MVMPAVPTARNAATTGTSNSERCVYLIRKMVLCGELLPGQKVNQVELADRLEVSRVPVREALAKLHSEGVLTHKPNTGYTVARFSRENLAEIYLMRRLLETELIRSTDLSSVDIAEMISLNDQMKHTSLDGFEEKYQQLNQAFHFTLFDHSPLELVRNEVARLWYMSGFYRSLYLFETHTATHLDDEHDRIIDAVRAKDTDRLVKACDEHRAGTERFVAQRFRWRPNS
jgi:DNA-binding GntR family transcriptional regulator